MSRTAEQLLRRRQQWQQLEKLLDQLGQRRRHARGQALMELSDLYRSACSDLAMAEQYRLSPETVTYLHSLVGRAHSTLYRSRHLQHQHWLI